MSKRSQMRLATEEDLELLYGTGRIMIGCPVRPPGWRPPSSGDTSPPTTEQPAAEEDRAPASSRSRVCGSEIVHDRGWH